MRPDTDDFSTLCRWHPSRRAVGLCEACGRHLCQPCVLDGHPCAPTDAGPSGLGAGRRLALVVGVLTLAGAAGTPWVLKELPYRTARAASPSIPPGRLSPAPPRVGSTIVRTRPAAPPPATAPSGSGPDLPTPLRPAPVPRPEPTLRSAASFDRGSAGRPEILLSFDAAETTSGAEEILAALDSSAVRTTFFVTGQFIRAHPDLVRRLLAAGHEVANHTDTHPHLTTWGRERRHRTAPGVDIAFLTRELDATAAAFQTATGLEMARLWRAPYGEHNDEIRAWAAAAGWRHVGWTAPLDSLDWVADPASRLYRPPDEIARRLLDWPLRDAHAGRGGIILMHIGSHRAPDERLAALLPDLIAGYRSRGLEFVTASAMMRPSLAPQGG